MDTLSIQVTDTNYVVFFGFSYVPNVVGRYKVHKYNLNNEGERVVSRISTNEYDVTKDRLEYWKCKTTI